MPHDASNARWSTAVTPVVAHRLLILVALCAFLWSVGPARADNIDVLIGDLRTGSDFKIRLSAALSLAKLGDQRAIPAFVAALSDADKTVRGAAAVGLGRIVNATTSAAQRAQAVKALAALASRETSESVKKQAANAEQMIRTLDAGAVDGAGRTVFVDIGPMSSSVEPATKLREAMRRVTEQTFRTKAANLMSLVWPGGNVPTRKELDAKKMTGYHVDGTLTELVVKENGSSATVSCKISMLIATFPEKSVFGFLKGGASVSATTDLADIALAQEDCLSAVVADLVNKKIIPTIKIKAGL